MQPYTREDALFFHQRLPSRLWQVFRKAGIPDELIHRRLLGWDGLRITVPVFGRDRQLDRIIHLEDPRRDGLRVVEEERLGPAQIYGWEALLARPRTLFITAEPWERLLLEARGLRAISILGDAATTKGSWVEDFKGTSVFIAFGRSGRSFRAARQLAEIIPQVRLVYFPPEVGDGGVTEYFLTLKRSRSDFLSLLPPAETVESDEE